MAKQIIESLFTQLGFDIDTKELDKFQSHVNGAKESLYALGKAAVGAATAIGGFVILVAKHLDEAGDFADRYDQSAAAIDELGHAAQLSGSSIAAVTSTVASLTSNIGQAVLGVGRAKMIFEKLNVAVKNADGSVKSFDEVLYDIADKMQGMSRQEAIGFAEKLGIDASLVPLLLKGRDAIAALRAEAKAFGAVTEEQTATAGEFMDSYDRTMFVLRRLTNTIAVALMPQVQRVLDGFREWVLTNRDLLRENISEALSVLGKVIGILWDVLSGVLSVITDVVQWLVKFKLVTYLAAFAVAFLIALKVGMFFLNLVSAVRAAALMIMGFNAAVLLIPALIGAAIIAVGLLIDDFLTWQEGGDSFIGEMLAKFPVFTAALEIIGETFRRMFDSAANGIALVIGAVDDAKVAFKQIVKALSDMFTAVWQFGGDVFDKLKGKVTGFIDSVLGAIGKVAKLLGLTDEAGEIKVTVANAANDNRAASPALITAPQGGILGRAESTTNNASSVNVQTKIDAPITITSNDPKQAGVAVQEHLDRMNQQTVRNGQSRVRL